VGSDCQHVTVIKVGFWPISRHINVWSEISWMDKRTLKKVRKRLKDSPVGGAGEMDSIILWGWGLDDKVEIVSRGQLPHG
jgi:hypothetical protein